MAERVYFVPVIGTGTMTDRRRPKYFADGTVTGVSWSLMDYGFEPWAIVVSDLSAEQFATVSGQADVLVPPLNLANDIGADLSQLVSFLEAFYIPAGWVTDQMSWRSVLRKVLAVYEFWQRFTALIGDRGFKGGVTLSTTLGEIPVGARNKLNEAADDLGLSRAGITLSTTLRELLKALADQRSVSRRVGGLTI